MKSLELFSGAGGLACGLAQAGFEHAALVEFNPQACASLRANFHPGQVFCGDVRQFDLDKVPAVDLVAGGPPCQPFSLGGKHQGYDDSRDMFPHAIAAIERLKPQAFLFENVKGLLRASFADYFDYILLRLTYPGCKAPAASDWRDHLDLLRALQTMPYTGTRYKVQFKLLNAADYGVPQTRERVIIVGVRADLGVDWHFPEPTHAEDRLLWDMHVTGTYWQRHHTPPRPAEASAAKKVAQLQRRYGLFEPAAAPWQTIRDALHGVPDPESAHGIADHQYRGGARTYPGHTGSDLDWPAKTIKAGDHGVPGGENMIRYPDGSVRYFTVFEAKRIQTFADDYQVTGAWGEAMRQIGNAVPVRLGQVLGQQLRDTLAQAHRERARLRR